VVTAIVITAIVITAITVTIVTMIMVATIIIAMTFGRIFNQSKVTNLPQKKISFLLRLSS
jgi:hypothetical protein